MNERTDWIDELLAGWQREYPELDTSPLPPLVRLARLAILIQKFQDDVLEPFELTPSDYAVIAALRRAGGDYALNPSQLYNLLQRSSGGMTKIVNRLEQRGSVKRMPDPEDRRGSRVSLTPDGLALQDRVFQAFLVASHELLADYPADRRQEADQMLRELLQLFEGRLR